MPANETEIPNTNQTEVETNSTETEVDVNSTAPASNETLDGNSTSNETAANITIEGDSPNQTEGANSTNTTEVNSTEAVKNQTVIVIQPIIDPVEQ